MDIKQQQRAMASMIRAGHDFAIARAIVAIEPGAEPDLSDFFDQR